MAHKNVGEIVTKWLKKLWVRQSVKGSQKYINTNHTALSTAYQLNTKYYGGSYYG